MERYRSAERAAARDPDEAARRSASVAEESRGPEKPARRWPRARVAGNARELLRIPQERGRQVGEDRGGQWRGGPMTYAVIARCSRSGQFGIGIASYSI